MGVRYGALESAHSTLEMLANQRFPAKLRLQLRRVMKAVDEVIQPLHQERDALIKEYGEDGSIRVDSPGWKDFESEYQPMLNEEVDFICEEKLSEEILERAQMSIREEDFLRDCGIIS